MEGGERDLGLPLDMSEGEVGGLEEFEGLVHGFLGVVLRLTVDVEDAVGEGGERGHCQVGCFVRSDMDMVC